VDVHAGQIGYYPEGVRYSIDARACDFLLLQLGGASGKGVIPYPKLGEAIKELSNTGEFREGIFRVHGAETFPPGARRNQDAYEAIWGIPQGRTCELP